jgi:hypothetical protein
MKCSSPELPNGSHVAKMDIRADFWSDWVVDLKPMTRPKGWGNFGSSGRPAENQSGEKAE